MGRWVRCAIFLTLMLAANSAFAQHTYYISKSLGSNSNTAAQAQSKSTPWANLPGMVGCTAACASYSAVPGDRFILYGGDTWGNSDLGTVFLKSGSATSCDLPYGSGATSSCIYIGVDQTWFNAGICGPSFCRPIFDCGGVACRGTANFANYMFIVGSYVIVDNIEFTGLLSPGTSGSPAYVLTQSSGDEVFNCYFHGWTIASGATRDFGGLTGFANNSFPPFSSAGSGLFYSVIDGSDASVPSEVAIGGSPTFVVGNIWKNVTNGLEGAASIVHDNRCDTMPASFQNAAHQNCFQIATLNKGDAVGFIYNNVVTNVATGGIVKYWWAQNSANAGTTWYVFNNILYNVAPGNNVDICQLGASCGTHFVFNNTWECGNDSSTGDCIGPGSTPTGTVTLINNHCITSGLCINTTGHNFTSTETTDLRQTVAAANGQGYRSGSTFAFQPTSATGGTVTQGTNKQALCTTIAALDTDAGAACQSDATYSCVYNTANHTQMCPNRTVITRPPAGGAVWDIGAFQFQASVPPNAASSLAATAH